ncbi:MAG: hypothetical protein MJ016_02255 [Victivallaceae bacterium]|nr:hypothetical protein [Victivallaceae bacterium]
MTEKEFTATIEKIKKEIHYLMTETDLALHQLDELRKYIADIRNGIPRAIDKICEQISDGEEKCK